MSTSNRNGSRPGLTAFTGQRFGKGIVLEPEVRVYVTERKPQGYRAARMLCDCGTKYLAPLSALYRGHNRACPGCSLRDKGARKRRVGGSVHRTNKGFTVQVYVGHRKTRAEAEELARRARAVILPADRVPVRRP